MIITAKFVPNQEGREPQTNLHRVQVPRGPLFGWTISRSNALVESELDLEWRRK
jgi:hypothetical protein